MTTAVHDLHDLHDLAHAHASALADERRYAAERAELLRQRSAVERAQIIAQERHAAALAAHDQAQQALDDAITLAALGATTAAREAAQARLDAACAALETTEGELSELGALHADLEQRMAAAADAEQQAREQAEDAERDILLTERAALVAAVQRAHRDLARALCDVGAWNHARGLLERVNPVGMLTSSEPAPRIRTSLNGHVAVRSQAGVEPIDVEHDRLLLASAYYSKLVTTAEPPTWLAADLFGEAQAGE